jgi:hypothetical protein
MAQNPRVSAPHVPGEVIEDEQAQAAAQAAPATVTMSKEQFDALMGRVSALEARPAASVASPQPQNLPKVRDIDQSNLTAPVLSDEGWVVPTNFGYNPTAPK